MPSGADGAGGIGSDLPPNLPLEISGQKSDEEPVAEGRGLSVSNYLKSRVRVFFESAGEFVRSSFPVFFGGKPPIEYFFNTDIDLKLIEAKSGTVLRVSSIGADGLVIEGDVYDVASLAQLMLEDDLASSGSPSYRGSVDWSLSSVVGHIRGDVPDGGHQPNFGSGNLTFSPYLNHRTGLYGVVLYPNSFSKISERYKGYIDSFRARSERAIEESVRRDSLSNVILFIESLIAGNMTEEEGERAAGMLNPSYMDVQTAVTDHDGKGLFWKDAGIRLSAGGRFAAFVISFIEDAEDEGPADVAFVGRPTEHTRTIEWGVTSRRGGASPAYYFVRYLPVLSQMFADNVRHAVNLFRSTDAGGNGVPPAESGDGNKGVKVGGLLPAVEEGGSTLDGGARMVSVRRRSPVVATVNAMFAGAVRVFRPNFSFFQAPRPATGLI